jgi:hypothetical protein
VYTFRTPPVPTAPTLQSPTNGAVASSLTPTLDWSDVAFATSYKVELRENASWGTLVANPTATGESSLTLASTLVSGRTYYWKVGSINAAVNPDSPPSGVWSGWFSFRAP